MDSAEAMRCPSAGIETAISKPYLVVPGLNCATFYSILGSCRFKAVENAPDASFSFIEDLCLLSDRGSRFA